MKPIVSANSRIRHREHFVIGDDSIVDDYCYFSTRVRIGRCTHIASGCSIAGGAEMKFEIGQYCSLSSGVKIWCTSDDFVNDVVTIIPSDPGRRHPGGLHRGRFELRDHAEQPRARRDGRGGAQFRAGILRIPSMERLRGHTDSISPAPKSGERNGTGPQAGSNARGAVQAGVIGNGNAARSCGVSAGHSMGLRRSASALTLV
jgi:hypothetical protein